MQFISFTTGEEAMKMHTDADVLVKQLGRPEESTGLFFSITFFSFNTVLGGRHIQVLEDKYTM